MNGYDRPAHPWMRVLFVWSAGDGPRFLGPGLVTVGPDAVVLQGWALHRPGILAALAILGAAGALAFLSPWAGAAALPLLAVVRIRKVHVITLSLAHLRERRIGRGRGRLTSRSPNGKPLRLHLRAPAHALVDLFESPTPAAL